MATAGVKRSFVTASMDDDDDVENHHQLENPTKFIRVDSRNAYNASPREPQSPRTSSSSRYSMAACSRPETPVTRPATPVTHLPNEIPPFPADASIVLAGIRGAGKSTLAIIASTAMARRATDCEKAFQQATGLTSFAYKRAHGPAECHRRQTDVLRDLLEQNSRGCLIVCSWMERGVQTLLRDFCRTNPVVHIVRDVKAIQEHLKIEDEDKARNLLAASSTIFRTCSNLEFFNVSETADPWIETEAARIEAHAGGQKPPAPYLTLKRAERHFLKFLSLIMPKGSIPFIESAFPLASIPTEDRRFTYAISVSLSSLLNNEIDIEELETGADAIEIVVDGISGGTTLDSERAADIARIIGSIRRSTVIPLIYHVVLPDSSETVYMDYILHGLRLSPEYLTVDLRLNDYQLLHIISMKRRSKIIGHLTPAVDSPSWGDSFWVSHYHRARRLGCDLVRLIKPVTSIKDNFDVNHLKALVEASPGHKVPLIAYNSGPRGRHSAAMNHVLTSVVPEPMAASHNHQQPCLTAVQATQALYSSFLFDPMKIYVFGAHVSYSLSPAMHNAALKACGIPHVYRPFSTPSLNGLRELIEDPYFAGASVGLPFKVEIITLTHSLSRHAQAIGAVNTLVPVRRLNPDGTIPEDEKLFNCRNRAGPVRALYGENTDWIGIRACLRRGLSPANAVRPTSCGLIIGAGGMARAATYSMLQLGVKNIVVYNRTIANAEKMVSHFTRLLKRHDLPLLSANADVETRFHIIRNLNESWPEDFRLPTMIVSCIPTHSIGDVPAPNFLAPQAWLGSPTGGCLVELGYKTLDTPILNQARQVSHRGWVTMDGLDLLPEQGFAQFELFTGRRAPRRLMRGEVFRSYEPDGQDRSALAQLQPRLNNIVEQEP
ncbi:quinate pathway repressor protein [Colletotrichum truncatum]|uniref:Quinate pathway repressor protein n=1 Tax=Colletotrichum truncatum TaxID=5467 RepID=A0ACC3YCX4_COLTU|nr:quinate pathway repressor protein [Colletotrichum truncatum]KAF6783506.1 quinate pathway repressor protein [Colletotrichum truncatum]